MLFTVLLLQKKIREKVNEWQNRPLDKTYPIIFMDATVLKIRADRVVKHSCLYHTKQF